ncbi:nuclease-related domain-containing protein [Bacillus sp. FJAT-22090]|uniref:nuclease-related domain-containing protein n=1 Tax=Bacillus sp. FJAT-22090 TaxID=1581038 RepID=UPI0011A16D83|nr:nuclease-related domain-containing protein [Bacillus sp. FJAT-22090]
MIVKKYTTSLYAEALHALYKRIPRDHSKFSTIQEDHYQKVAGDIGEEVVMKVVEQLTLPYKFYAFHNISIYNESLFQMDILIITPYYALIFEVKNIKGEIMFTDQQLIRTLPSKEISSFDNPILQVEDYEYQLKHVFQTNNIPLPIYGAIVFAFSSSIIKVPPKNKTILFRRGIKSYLRNIQIGPRMLTDTQLEHVKDFLLKANTDFQSFPITKHYGIDPTSIRGGVECIHCGLIGMKKLSRNWFCPRCKVYHRTAHENALKDYFLVFKNTMTNQDCQQFLKLNNKHEATRILRNSMLMKSGQSRNRKYSMPFHK